MLGPKDLSSTLRSGVILSPGGLGRDVLSRSLHREGSLPYTPILAYPDCLPQLFLKRTRIPASAEAVYAWHTEPGALERLTPPWERAQVIEPTGGIEEPGSRGSLPIATASRPKHSPTALLCSAGPRALW